MKFLIWLACIIVPNLIKFVFFYDVLLGAIPTILLYAPFFWGARTLCREWDEHKESKKRKKAMDLYWAGLSDAKKHSADIGPIVSDVQGSMDSDCVISDGVHHSEESSHSKLGVPIVDSDNQSLVIESPPLHDNEIKINNIKPEPATKLLDNSKRRISRVRFCKYCGGKIDSDSKKCSSCGKQFFRMPKISAYKSVLVVMVAVLVLVFVVGAYFGYNYFNGVEAMNEQRFIVAQQYFDNMFIGEKIFPNKYAYVKAGVLKETGKPMAALYEFNNLEGIPVPASLIEDLKEEIYNDGIEEYRKGSITVAKTYFTVLGEYKRSSDYILLIQSEMSVLSAESNYENLLDLIGFEGAEEIFYQYNSLLTKFLSGRWESNSKPMYYFELFSGGSTKYNLPHDNVNGTYSLIGQRFVVRRSDTLGHSSISIHFKFTIIDKDTISVYCYQDGSTHKLYRQ